VHRLVVGIVFIQGAAPRTLEDWLKPELAPVGNGGVRPATVTTVSILPSGHWQVWIYEAAFGVMAGRIGAEVAFTDRAGRYWVRRATRPLDAARAAHSSGLIPTIPGFEQGYEHTAAAVAGGLGAQ
jgi:hypothetical protein